MKKILLLASLMSLNAYGASSQPLSGKINGKDFVARSGFARVNSDQSVRIEIYNTEAQGDICQRANIPTTGLGVYAWTDGLWGTLFDMNSNPPYNAIADEEMILDVVNDEFVKGTLKIDFDEENYVEGEFNLKICK